MTIVRARRTWAAAVTRLKAMMRSWGFSKAAACSPRVILPEELFSTEPWQPVKRQRKAGSPEEETPRLPWRPLGDRLERKKREKPNVVQGALKALQPMLGLSGHSASSPCPALWHEARVAAVDSFPESFPWFIPGSWV